MPGCLFGSGCYFSGVFRVHFCQSAQGWRALFTQTQQVSRSPGFFALLALALCSLRLLLLSVELCGCFLLCRVFCGCLHSSLWWCTGCTLGGFSGFSHWLPASTLGTLTSQWPLVCWLYSLVDLGFGCGAPYRGCLHAGSGAGTLI